MERSAFRGWILLGTLLAIIASAIYSSTVRADAPASHPTTAAASGQETRNAFLAIIDRQRVDPAVQVTPRAVSDGDVARFRFEYSSEANQRVPGILLATQDALKYASVIPRRSCCT
jgi:riboflavin biosynthesis pyrimidine reductase